MKDVNGSWLTDEVEIKEYIINGFKNLYMTELNLSSMTLHVSKFSCCFLEKED